MIVAIELTEQQRQAIEAQQGQPVELVDPATNRTYFLIARDAYERFHDLLEQQKAAGSPHAITAGTPETQAPAARPMRQRLRDLATPPEVAEKVRRRCEKLGLCRKESREAVVEDLKLQYYFGGRYIGYLRTEEGKVVVAVGRLDSEEFGRQLDALNPDERRKVVLDVPSRWNESISQILTPFAYES